MTSTNMFSGNFNDKPSSRVLKPPGGGNSNIFGPVDDSSTIVDAHDKKLPAQSTTPKNCDIPKTETSNGNEASPSVVAEPQQIKNSVSEVSNKVNSNSNEPPKSYKNRQQASYNPITGEPYNKTSNAPKVEESKTVTNSTTGRQPPGGASTKLW